MRLVAGEIDGKPPLSAQARERFSAISKASSMFNQPNPWAYRSSSILLALRFNRPVISLLLRLRFAWRINAMAPAAYAAAKAVPENWPYWSSLDAAATACRVAVSGGRRGAIRLTPGQRKSGFWRPSAVGPRDENVA